MITGKGRVVAHLGYPTTSFKAPMIYNPWFEARGIDAVVVPLGVRPEDFAAMFRDLFRITTLHGALVTMPHKVAVTALVDEVTATASIAGACNAVLKRPDGSLLGDMFDGAGFVRGMERKGQAVAGARALVVGAGGVGCAIAASLAGAGLAGIDPVRRQRRGGRGPGRAAAPPLPGAASADRLARPGGLRHRRQRHADGHEPGRPAAGGHRPRRTRQPSWARW